MKTLKLTALFLSMLIINSCNNREKEDKIEDNDIIPLFLTSISHTLIGALNYHQELLISFQDESGNDLVKGIEFLVNEWLDTLFVGDINVRGVVRSELYTLNYIYDDVFVRYNFVDDFEVEYPMLYRPMGLRKGEPFSKIYPELNGNYDYLFFQAFSAEGNPYKECPFNEKVTFRLTCPYIFGDDAPHDIDTWWRRSEEDKEFPLCYRIKFGDKEFTEIAYTYDIQYEKDGLRWSVPWPYSVATIVLDR